MKLERTIAPLFIKIFEEIQNIPPQPRIEEVSILCPRCGKKIIEITLFVRNAELKCLYKKFNKFNNLII